MKFSEKIDEIATALAKAQGIYEQPKKTCEAKIPTKNGGSYSYKYAGLPDIIEALKKPFAENGLSYVQSPSLSNGEVIITTLLIHTSGQWFQSIITMRPVDLKPQSIGSTITYARRYALASIAGLAAEDDEDGNIANGHSNAQTSHRKKQQKQKPPRLVSPEDIIRLKKRLSDNPEAISIPDFFDHLEKTYKVNEHNLMSLNVSQLHLINEMIRVKIENEISKKENSGPSSENGSPSNDGPK